MSRKHGSEYDGPRAHTVGHRQYDQLLKDVIEAVRDNWSREDLLELFLEGIHELSTADAIVVLSVLADRQDDGTERVLLKGLSQRGVHPGRWQRFMDEEAATIPDGSIIHRVIEGGLEVDVWGTACFGHEFDVFRPLFDISKGGWIAGLQLRRPTARHPNAGIFLWYKTGKGGDRVPHGAEQDWRFLTFFRHCYEMANYRIRQAARDIIKQRQELLRMLAPSILNHEIQARVRPLTTQVERTLNDLRDALEQLDKRSGKAKARQLVESAESRLEKQFIGNAQRLLDFSESLMGLTRRKGSVRRSDTGMDLVREVRMAMLLVQPSADKCNVNLIPPPAVDALPKLDTDAALVMHVLVNLLTNAVDALAPVELTSWHADDAKKVWIEIEHLPGVSRPVVVRVCDNGPGVPEELTRRIFEPGITAKSEGHGLGLSICRMIAGYLGASLSLESRSEPTVFALHLPLSAPRVADLEEELKSLGEFE